MTQIMKFQIKRGITENRMLSNVDDQSILGDSDDTQLRDENEEDIDSFSTELSSKDDDTNACNADENVSLESELGEWQSKHKLAREARA